MKSCCKPIFHSVPPGFPGLLIEAMQEYNHVRSEKVGGCGLKQISLLWGCSKPLLSVCVCPFSVQEGTTIHSFPTTFDQRTLWSQSISGTSYEHNSLENVDLIISLKSRHKAKSIYFYRTVKRFFFLGQGRLIQEQDVEFSQPKTVIEEISFQ